MLIHMYNICILRTSKTLTIHRLYKGEGDLNSPHCGDKCHTMGIALTLVSWPYI